MGDARSSVVALVVAAAFITSPAFAQTAPQTDDTTTRGRNAYARGVELSKQEQWSDALAAFEEAAAARDAPLVQYNIVYCQRALGRYVAARKTTRRVLESTTGLDSAKVEDLKGYLAEFEKIIVRVDVTLDPIEAVLVVDGRPLVPEDGSPDTYLGSMGPAAAASPLGKRAFAVLLDPGVHLFNAARPGHQDAVVRKSYRAGERATLDLHLDVLPATIAIRSEPSNAIVRIDKREVGLAPIEFQRPAGTYKLEVMLDRFESYAATLDLQPGQRSELTAKLNPYTEPLTKKWWFWTGAAVVVVGGAALTYALTRPAPQPPAYDAGSANWLVHAQGIRF
jgi:hypothetical protein